MQLPFAFRPEGEAVFIKSEISDEKVPWSYFIKWKEGKKTFVLYHSDIMFRIIPKRCFVSPSEMTQFRELLQWKLGPARV